MANFLGGEERGGAEVIEWSPGEGAQSELVNLDGLNARLFIRVTPSRISLHKFPISRFVDRDARTQRSPDSSSCVHEQITTARARHELK